MTLQLSGFFGFHSFLLTLNLYVMNSRQKLHSKTCLRIKNTVLNDDEHIVQPGLAVTPSQMLQLTERGVAISPQNLPETMFSDNDHTRITDFHVNLEERRGFDMNDCWEAQQDIKKKVRMAHKDGAFESSNPKGGE